MCVFINLGVRVSFVNVSTHNSRIVLVSIYAIRIQLMQSRQSDTIASPANKIPVCAISKYFKFLVVGAVLL
jgi:hypothetical protein